MAGLRRRGTGAGAGALVIVAITGALAVANSSLTVPSGESKTGSKPCERGELATGGGFTSSATTRWDVLALQPQGRRWATTLLNQGGADQQAKVNAVCSNASRYRLKSKEVTEPIAPFAGLTKELDVKCPSGTTAAGGGFGPTESPSSTIAPLDSAPLNDRKWHTRVYTTGGSSGGDATFRAYVVCDRKGADYSVRSLSFTEDPPRAMRGTEVPFDESVACGNRQRLTSGGFASDDLNVYYRRMQAAGNGWRLAGGTYTSIPITVYAVCQK